MPLKKNRRRKWRSYSEARNFARTAGVRGVTQWRLLCAGGIRGLTRLPRDIPRDPSRAYAGRGWVSWGEFLGTGTRWGHHRAWRPYTDASAYAISLGIRTGQQWDDYCAGRIPGAPPRPDDIPADPAIAYRGCGWAGFPAFLGTDFTNRARTPRMVLRPFEAARAFARTIGVRTSVEWRAYCEGRFPGTPQRPSDIPIEPHISYKGRGWVSWPDFLGTEPQGNPSTMTALLDIILR